MAQPKGKLRIRRDSQHRYWYGKRWLVGNTEALGSVGILDTTRFTMGGQQRGTDVHLATKYLDQRKLDWRTVDPIRGYLAGYRRAKAMLGLVIEAREEVTGNLIYGFGTTIDIRGRMRNVRRAIVEIKTGNPEPWWGLQLALQGLCYRGDYQLFALQLWANGKFKLHTHYKERRFGCTEDRMTALNAVGIANWKRRNQ